MTLKNKIEFISIKSIMILLNLLPYSMLMKFASCLGSFTFSFIRIRRKVVIENIKNAFPELSSREVLNLAKKSYQHFSKIFLELAHLNQFSSEQLKAKIIVKTPEVIEEIKSSGKGQIILIGHFGSWEVFALYFSLIKDFAAIAKKQKDQVIEDFILSLRTRFGGKIFYSREPITNGIQWLKKGNAFTIVGDQDARHHGIFVPFLGQPSSTYTGVSIFALRSKVDVYFATPVRTRDGKYEISIEKIHAVEEGYPKGFSKELITRYMNKLEEAVRKHPEQYFWMHKRWKTKPPEEHNE